VPHAVPAPARSVLLIRGAGAGPAGLEMGPGFGGLVARVRPLPCWR
jgi:hypothetical protein